MTDKSTAGRVDYLKGTLPYSEMDIEQLREWIKRCIPSTRDEEDETDARWLATLDEARERIEGLERDLDAAVGLLREALTQHENRCDCGGGACSCLAWVDGTRALLARIDGKGDSEQDGGPK
jgi:hypothetical protein